MTQKLNITLTIAPLITLILIDLMFYYAVEIGSNTKIYAEDHILENTQAVILALGTAIYLKAALHVSKNQRLLAFIGALFCFSCLLRELEIKDYDLPQLIIVLGSGYGRKILVIGLWMLVTVLFIRNYRHYLPIAVGLMSSRTGFFIIAGGLLLILGGMFEEQLFDVKYYVFYEELAEMNGYYFILVGALNIFFDLQAQRAKAETKAIAQAV